MLQIIEALFSGSMGEAHMSGTWGEWADPCIARLIGTQEILFRVRGTDKEAFATLAVPCMKADGRTIKNTGRLIEFNANYF